MRAIYEMCAQNRKRACIEKINKHIHVPSRAPYFVTTQNTNSLMLPTIIQGGVTLNVD